MPAALGYVAGALYSAGYVETAIFIADYAYAIATVIEIGVAVAYQRDQARRAENQARDAYNASLRDRYAMVRAATKPRQVVLGRQRVSGPVGFIRSSDPYNSTLIMTVLLAAHEIDAIEAVYFDDEQVALDSSGNVIGINRVEVFSIAAATATVTLSSYPANGTITAKAIYGTTVTPLTVTSSSQTSYSVSVSGASSTATGELQITYQPYPNPFAGKDQGKSVQDSFPITAATQTFTLNNLPINGAVQLTQDNGASSPEYLTFGSVTLDSISGNSITCSGLNVGWFLRANYQIQAPATAAKITMHLGQAGQTADADMLAALPGIWTSAHIGSSIAYLTVELQYNENAFPSGLPNVSALVRGMKCYDPRTATTAWSENPAVLLRAYATHPFGGRLDPSLIDDTSIIAAANVCDTSATYPVGGQSYVRPLYKAGTVTDASVRPQDVVDSLVQAMGGKWAFADGKLRVLAGSYPTPVPRVLDESWLHNGGAIAVQPTYARTDTINTSQGVFADERQDYKVVQYPKIVASAYVAADGKEMPSTVQFNSATFVGQVSYIASCQLRYARQGLTLKVTCNMRAYELEPFDVVPVTLSRFGWVNKPFEVLETSWTVDGGIILSLKEIDPSIWTMDAAFSATDPAPNTRLPNAYTLPAITNLTLLSDSTTLYLQPDGTVVSQIKASWDAQTDNRITQSGQIEVRYGTWFSSEASWQSVFVGGASTTAYLTGLIPGYSYLVKARTIGSISKGVWCGQQSVIAAVKVSRPSNVSGFTGTVTKGVITWTWNANTDTDYGWTEIRSTDANWGSTSSLPLFRGTTNTWSVSAVTPATWTLYIRHFDASGNSSATSASATVVVASTDLGTVTLSASGVLSGNGSGAVTLPGMGQHTYRVTAAGLSATTYPAVGVYLDGGAVQYGGLRSYNMARISRATGLVDFQAIYDVFGVGTSGVTTNTAATLAADLNATGSDHIVVIWTWDEPLTNRLTSGLDTAMYRCGASRAVFGSSQFQARAAYILIGIPGCGEGNGAEFYQGSISSDPNAWCDASFTVLNGGITGVSTTYKPRTLTDYGYTGDLAATKNIVTYSATAPSSPANGDVWVNTGVTPNQTEVYAGGAWQVAANLSTNTNQLTDGANLGGTATWSGVSGTGKPADNATVGAPSGTPVAGIFPGSTAAATVETNANNAYTGLTAAITGSLSGTFSKSISATGNIVIGTPSVSASGGTSPLTYSWSLTNTGNDLANGDYLYLTGTLTSATIGLSGALSTSSPQNVRAQVYCVVTDANGRSITLQNVALLTHP